MSSHRFAQRSQTFDFVEALGRRKNICGLKAAEFPGRRFIRGPFRQRAPQIVFQPVVPASLQMIRGDRACGSPAAIATCAAARGLSHTSSWGKTSNSPLRAFLPVSSAWISRAPAMRRFQPSAITTMPPSPAVNSQGRQRDGSASGEPAGRRPSQTPGPITSAIQVNPSPAQTQRAVASRLRIIRAAASASNRTRGGTAGRMYPGNLDFETLKKKQREAYPAREIESRPVGPVTTPYGFARIVSGGAQNRAPWQQGQYQNWDEKPPRLHMVEHRRREAFEIMEQKKRS